MKRKTIMTAVLIAAVVFSVGGVVSAASAKPDAIKSQGRIVFDNNTENPSDDVIFDAEDLYYLYSICQ